MVQGYEGQDFKPVLPEGARTAAASSDQRSPPAGRHRPQGRPHLRFYRRRQPQPWYRRTSGQSLNIALGLPEDAGLTKIRY